MARSTSGTCVTASDQLQTMININTGVVVIFIASINTVNVFTRCSGLNWDLGEALETHEHLCF